MNIFFKFQGKIFEIQVGMVSFFRPFSILFKKFYFKNNLRGDYLFCLALDHLKKKNFNWFRWLHECINRA